MAVKLKSIIKNDTWKLVERPENRDVISSLIVLRNKYDSNRTLERRKARIVARGFSQQPGIDFHETFASVACLSTIRVVAALAAEHGMIINHYDITIAYLNGKLEEQVFMEIPQLTSKILERIIGTEPKNSEVKRKAAKMLSEIPAGNKVCLLRKALYGFR